MDDRERDKFYAPPKPPGDDEDGEYEIEPPDPAVTSAEDRHGKEVLEAARTAIDIDEIYREAERDRGTEIVEEWIRNFRFRFQVKHLLVATAVLAIGMTLIKLGIFWPMVSILVLLAIAGSYSYLQWQERKQRAEADRKRDELYARRRDQLISRGVDIAPSRGSKLSSTPLPPDDADTIWQEATKREPFRFHFSLQSMIVAMTAAAIMFGMIRILGGAAPTATILGLIAVGGLIAHAIGYDPPQTVVLGWWFILVLYVLLSILGAVQVVLP